MSSQTPPAPLDESASLREQLWEVRYGQPITSADLRSLDHYPHIHKEFLKLEAFVQAQQTALVTRIRDEVIGRDEIEKDNSSGGDTYHPAAIVKNQLRSVQRVALNSILKEGSK